MYAYYMNALYFIHTVDTCMTAACFNVYDYVHNYVRLCTERILRVSINMKELLL